MLREALDFPTSGERGSAALLVGSALMLLSAIVAVVGAQVPVLLDGTDVVVPALLVVLVFVLQLAVRGYYVRVLRVTAVERAPVAPSFRAIGDLLRDGLAAVVIGLVYLLPTLLLFTIAAGGNLAGAVDNPLQLRDPTSIAAAETVGSLAALLGLFSALASLYLVPGAVTLYAHENRVRSAFDLRSVVRGTASEDYAVGWVLSLVLQALLLPLVLLLYSLLVGVVLHFLLGVAVRYMWGSSFGTAMGFALETVDTEGITPDSGFDRDPVDDTDAPDSTPSSADENTHVDAAAEPSVAPAVERVDRLSDDTSTDAGSLPNDEDSDVDATSTASDTGGTASDAGETDTHTETGTSDPMADESNR